MRLYEIESTPLYLSTSARLKVGSVIEQRSVYPLGATIEGKLEFRRPSNAIPRHMSFYLHHVADDAPYIYRVEAVGQIDRHHTSWLELLADTLVSNIGELDSYAIGYWTGKPHAEHQASPIEIRAAIVKVLKREGGWEVDDTH